MLLFLFLFRRLLGRFIALLANLVFLGSVFAARMRAFLALGYRFVAAGRVFLAFFAKLLVFMRVDAAFVLTVFTSRLGLNTTTLTGKGGAGTHHQSNSKGQSRQCFG